LKWIKVLAADMNSKTEEELLEEFGTTGFFIKIRLLQFLALNLDPSKEFWFNFEFDLVKFKQVFGHYGWRGNLFKVLNYLKDQGELTYKIKNKRIEIYSRTFEKSAQSYVDKAKRKAEKEDEKNEG